MSEHYKNAQEFIEDCETGLDIEFFYNGVGYCVFGWHEKGPVAFRGEQWGYEEQQFKDAQDLLDNFVIEGHPLSSIITKIELNLH